MIRFCCQVSQSIKSSWKDSWLRNDLFVSSIFKEVLTSTIIKFLKKTNKVTVQGPI